MTKSVGYLTNSPTGRAGEPGIFYNYIIAANGLFIEAENKLMEVRIPIAHCDIRGLEPLSTKFLLTYGSIPQRFFDLSLDMFLSDTTREHYVAVIGDSGYRFYVPIQDKGAGRVTYELGDSVILEMHSHHTMGSRFSETDNKDETGLKVYGVVGSLDKTPVVNLRLGVYGYFFPLAWKEVFDGCLVGAAEFEEEEVLIKDV